MRVAMILVAVLYFVALGATGEARSENTEARMQNAVTVDRQSSVVGRQSPVVGGADAVTIPQMLSYQGKLTDTDGRAVRDSNYSVTFNLYVEPSGGSAYWTETQTVQTRGGLFSVLLGSVEPVPGMSEDGNCYLGMQVGANPELTPRVRIVSAAYAYVAGRAASADSARPKGNASGDLSGFYPGPNIGTGKVNSEKIEDRSIKGVDIAMPCSLVSQVGNPYAALMIRALNTGNGIRIDSADNHGIVIHGTGNNGITIYETGSSGVYAYNIHDYAIRGSAVLVGGHFQAESARGVGVYARTYQGVAADTAIHADGKGVASGGWVTGFSDGEAPCIVSPERMMIASGSARMSGGRARIILPEFFVRHVRPDVPVRLNVTPTADAPGLLVAESQGNTGFLVRLRRVSGLDGSEDAPFDWIAVGILEEPSTKPIPELDSRRGR